MEAMCADPHKHCSARPDFALDTSRVLTPDHGLRFTVNLDQEPRTNANSSPRGSSRCFPPYDAERYSRVVVEPLRLEAVEG